MTAYDDLLRELLVERFRPVPPPRPPEPDTLAALARALPPPKRRASRTLRRRTPRGTPKGDAS